ncbi:putative chromatin organization modifier domain containing protein [Lyophyllum shimeji]|uniref:Chromatin organization modifier domain containing protein n=1 Tax=Lyophyllum shimeji TaxID=47721 RepID=A0A9P3Q1T6_LYOSH|nr:putative chromatin organization modifier domain containing protein [Lyophyllum shimeji]
MGKLHPLLIPEGRWSVVSVLHRRTPRGLRIRRGHGCGGLHGQACTLHPDAQHGTGRGKPLPQAHVEAARTPGHAFISDPGPQFVAEFTQELYCLLGIKLSTSVMYYPQSDGRLVDLLPEAEFQYNNHVQTATKYMPFMLDTGRNLRMGFEPRPLKSNNKTANEFFERMKLVQEEAKAALAKAKDDMARYYDQHRIPAPEYKPGDCVYLDASDIETTRPSKKLSHRYLGPYTIECQVGPLVYKLRLLCSMSHLHPVFNAVKLRLAPPDPIPGRRTRPPPPPTLIDNEEWFNVEDILDSRIFRRKLQYKVKWKGYGYEDAS